jgi:hypothetical protein
VIESLRAIARSNKKIAGRKTAGAAESQDLSVAGRQLSTAPRTGLHFSLGRC